MKIDQQNPDEPQPQKKLFLPARDTVTNVQVTTLLQIAAQLSVVLVNPLRESGTLPPPEVDGGVLAAAESAFIRCCDRLEDVLAEKDRWTMQAQNAIEHQLGKAYDAQADFYRSQTALTDLAQKPHTRYRPSLMPTTDGSYVAFLGSANDLEHSIFGIGGSPEEAMRAFDEVFKGKLPDNMIHWLASREAALEAGVKPPDFPARVVTNKKQHESKKLDGRAGRKTKTTPKRGKDDSGNSQLDSGPNDQGS